ncbi:hypothetical protein H3H36_18660 [Duganella sp. FT3S]|uniref:Uncharacterized protein n=1 Tax=Rugamonas fusca TaxID=2758568 RepID=A0A7W2I891_9BURK|nr:hypothetical protein [Rugamonas fusca]
MNEDLRKVQKIIVAALELKASHGVFFSACMLQEADVSLEVAILLLTNSLSLASSTLLLCYVRLG